MATMEERVKTKEPRDDEEIHSHWWNGIRAIESDCAPKLAEALAGCPEALNFHGALDSGSLTLLQVAAMRDKPRCLRMLVEAGCDAHEPLCWMDGAERSESTPMSQAIYCLNPSLRFEMFAAMMSRAPLGVGIHAEGWKLAMRAAAFQEDCVVMAAINAHCGADGKTLWPSIGAVDGESLFHLAAGSMEHGVEVLRALLSWDGMEEVLDRPDAYGLPPREFAKMLGNTAFIQEVDAWRTMRRESQEISAVASPWAETLGKRSDGPRL